MRRRGLPQARRDFWEEIHALSEEGLTVLVSTHYMDEAERCDRIVYILNGNLIARGTVAEVIAQSGLTTFVVEGPGVRHLIEKLQHVPGVEHVAFFGARLHVSGRDRASLERALAPYRGQAGIDIHEGSPSLEDVYLKLTEGPAASADQHRAGENRANEPRADDERAGERTTT